MAPPRQRPPLNPVLGGGAGDDSRSEASSTATGGPTSRGVPGPKPRKSGVASSISGAATTGTLASAKELKVAAATGAAAAASGLGQQDMYGLDGLRDDLPGVCSYRTPCRCCGRANGFWWIDTVAPNAPLNPARLQTRVQTLYTKRIRTTHIEDIFLLWHWSALPDGYSS